MKALHFVNHSFPVVDGYSIRTRYLVQSQQKLGLDPVVVTRPGFANDVPEGLQFRESREGIPHFHFTEKDYPLVRIAGGLRRTRTYLERGFTFPYYRRVIGECSPCSVFHVHMLPDQLRYLSPLSRRYKVPLIYEIRGVWEDTAVACGQIRPDSIAYKKRRDASTRAAKAADRVITISEALRQDFIGRGVPGDKISVVPNGVDTSIFLPSPRNQKLSEKLGIAGQTVFGYISTIRELEGLDFLVRAMPEILESVTNSVCLIVGDGDYAPRLRELVNNLGLETKVILTGRVPHDQVLEYYSLIDVFVVPRTNTRVNNLVTPLKPLEAMSMSKAMLVSGVGGLTELVEDGKTGLVFKPEDAQDLASKAILLARNSDLRMKLGEEARRFAVRERDWSKVIGRYQEKAMSIALANKP